MNECTFVPCHEFDFDGWRVVGNIFEAILLNRIIINTKRGN